YYRMNCSTKIRDALDQNGVLDGQIRRQLDPIPTGTTFRWHTRIGMAGNVWLYTGLEIAMGRPTDRPISAWDEGFIPMKLAEHLRRVNIADDSGKLVPLIKSERQLHKSTRPPLPIRPPMW